jgi:metal-responsive CopG/Arc/MetJ family transcriptional regulator
MDNKKKISIILEKDMAVRINRVHKQFVVKNKSELLRMLLDEAMKARGV